MTASTALTPPPVGTPPSPVASYRTNLVTALLGVWFTVGLMLDAWAHNNLVDLETFFTPWHGVFYSGFVATAGWIAWTSREALRDGMAAIPAGYRPAAFAVVGFAFAGSGDALWHTIFGIEQDIKILFSPTHLALAVTMLVIVTTPLRAAWADRSLPDRPGLRRLLPAVIAISLAATLALLFLQYSNALSYTSVDVIVALSGRERNFTADLVAGMAMTTLVLLAPLLTLARRWVLPFGTAIIAYAFAGGLSLAITGLGNLDLMIGLLIAAVGVDLLTLWLRPTALNLVRFRAFGALAPLVTWVVIFVTAYVTAPPLRFAQDVVHPEGVLELYTGAPIAQALLGLLLAVLLVPDRPGSRP